MRCQRATAEAKGLPHLAVLVVSFRTSEPKLVGLHEPRPDCSVEQLSISDPRRAHARRDLNFGFAVEILEGAEVKVQQARA